MSMLDNLKKAEVEYGLKSEYFKVKTGDNIVRVCSEGVPHEGSYQGKKQKAKFIMWVIDRADGRVKPYFAPYSVYSQIAGLEVDPFYAFEGMPMPYDINIKVKNAGTLEAEYLVQASPNRTSLTPDELKALQDVGTIEDYITKLNEKDADAAMVGQMMAPTAAKLTPAEIVGKASGGKFGAPSDADVPPADEDWINS